MVPRERLELPTCGLGNRCSVLLSYRGTIGFRKARRIGPGAAGQLHASGGTTGNGSGATGTPSSISAFASATLV
jgi:hypothetical protein